jgi:hypothetical protein
MVWMPAQQSTQNQLKGKEGTRLTNR